MHAGPARPAVTRPAHHGAVAGGHPASARAGAEVMRAGGNAADAAVAAVAAATVAEASLTGLGGGGFALVAAPDGTAELLDFFVAAPGIGRDDADREARSHLEPYEVPFHSATQIFNVGPASCAVPGMIPGLTALHQGYGRLPLTRVLAPAIRLAQEGAELVAQQDYLHDILEGILTRGPGITAVFAPEGRLLRHGDLIRSPDLADAMATWATEGAEAFSRGRYAERIADYMEANGGLITADDLAQYRVISREPVCVGYHGHTVLTNPLPSSGGTLIAFTLGLLDQMDLAGADRSARTEMLTVAFEATDAAREAAFNQRLYEPDFAREFLAPSHICDWGTRSSSLRAADDRQWLETPPVDSRRRRPTPPPLGNTTHVSAVDTDGLAVAVTSSCGSGSGVVIEGTGIIMNNMMGEEDLNPFGFFQSPLGSRLTSMMSPTITCGAACGDGRILALGSAGSNRLRSAIVQTLVNMLDLGYAAQQAVDDPRVHWDGRRVHLEGGMPGDAEVRLRATGREVQAWSVKDLFFGGVQVVSRAPAAGEVVFDGAGDPRRGGAALIV